MRIREDIVKEAIQSVRTRAGKPLVVFSIKDIAFFLHPQNFRYISLKENIFAKEED